MAARRRRPEPSDYDRVRTAFEPVRADRSHGARALSGEALRILSDLLAGWEQEPDVSLRAAFRRTARALESAQPAMGPFLRWAGEWRRMARVGVRGNRLRTARAWLRRERSRRAAETVRLTRTCAKSFPEDARHVVTLSRSETVLRGLSAVPSARRPDRISVLESLPGGEGRRFARELRNAGFAARVIPDREGPAVVRHADLVVVGADAVFSDGSVAHKVGTRALARAAHRSHVPVIVIAAVSKFTGRPAPRRPLPGWFDRTPSRFLTAFWTDRGVRPGGARPGRPPRRSSL